MPSNDLHLSRRFAQVGAIREQQRFDFSNPTTFYVGYATSGAAESDAKWVVKKIVFDGSGTPVASYWSAMGVKWTERLTLAYD